MRRPDSTSGTVLSFPRRQTTPPTRGDIERGIARGRRLQGEAVQAAFGRLLHWLVGGTSLRGLRAPASLPGRRHSCC